MTVELRTSLCVIPDRDGLVLNLGVLNDSDIEALDKDDAVKIFIPFPVQAVDDHFAFEFQGRRDRSPALAYIRMSDAPRSHLVTLGDNLAKILNERFSTQKAAGVRQILSCYGKAISSSYTVVEETRPTSEFLTLFLKSVNALLDQLPY